MGEKFTFSCQTKRINTMTFEDTDGEKGTDTYNHQRYKELIATCEFGNQEDTCEWCMHYTSHYSCHSHQSEVLLRNVDSYLILIPESGEKESCKTSNKEGWGEGTTTSACTIGG